MPIETSDIQAQLTGGGYTLTMTSEQIAIARADTTAALIFSAAGREGLDLLAHVRQCQEITVECYPEIG